jgi:hypothetical protein
MLWGTWGRLVDLFRTRNIEFGFTLQDFYEVSSFFKIQPLII